MLNESVTAKDVATWNAARLTQWLRDNGIATPSSFTSEQLSELVQANWDAAQRAMGIKSRDPTWLQNVKSGAFETYVG